MNLIKECSAYNFFTMKNVKIVIVLFISILAIGYKSIKESSESETQSSWIRINNLGYLPNSMKVAVIGSKLNLDVTEFTLHEASSNKVVFTSGQVEPKGNYGPFKTSFRLNFSPFKKLGMYYLQVDKIKSNIFRIDPSVYDNSADYLLKYMRQQRCFFNPFLNDSCHLDDGYIVYPENRRGERIDVTGGWHDATDYLQYTATSANAVFQLLFAYRDNPKVFGDAYQANGMPGTNGIPDIIDEAKFGMDWLKKMNPNPSEYYNQIADDRDHAGFRLPTLDKVVYSEKHKGRPVYSVSDKKQGLFKYKNRSTGTASTSGKFASAFALGSEVLKEFFPEYSKDLSQRAMDAYEFGKINPGVSQTAPGKAPYFYEEENWIDDMELGASTLYNLTKKEKYKIDALDFARMEITSPWIGLDSVNHYQYYPFLNAGHYQLAVNLLDNEKTVVTNYYNKGLELLYQKGKNNPFLIGIPFVWCSNNFVTAAVTQCELYRNLSNSNKYEEMEVALRDWLFGCNPWGTSMIVGLPYYGDSPEYPHSSLNHLNGYQTYGGLIDGPVYGSIFNSLLGLKLQLEDSYADLQSDYFVYHDDVGDYSTNEPTMDGTASLVYYLSSLEIESRNNGHIKYRNSIDKSGAIVRGDRSLKKIHLLFSGHEYADGGNQILNILEKHQIKASFFLTGDFYRNENFKEFIYAVKKNGHYLGAHSDKHLLYNDWSKNKTLLVSEEVFKQDLLKNYDEMKKFGISQKEAPYFLPPYEWNDENITQWANQLNIALINYSSGTLSNADYTIPADNNYRSSDEIYNSILKEESLNGLNGFLLLSHIGSDSERTDKFYKKLDKLLTELQKRGYEFSDLESVLSLKNSIK